METHHLSISHSRRIVSAHFVHRIRPNWPQKGAFCPSQHFLYYQVEGVRTMEDEEGPFALNPGDAILFFKGNAYPSYRPPGSYRAMNVLFTSLDTDTTRTGKPVVRGLVKEDMLAIASRIPTGGDPMIRARFSEVVQLSNSPLPLRRRKASALLEDLLIDLAMRSDPSEQPWGPLVEYVLGFMDRHLDRKLSIDELADLVGISRRSLTRRFRRATGRSITAYHLEKRVAVAASMLRIHPDITLREVADTLGFCDEFHFSRTFRKHMGVSPRDFAAASA